MNISTCEPQPLHLKPQAEYSFISLQVYQQKELDFFLLGLASSGGRTDQTERHRMKSV